MNSVLFYKFMSGFYDLLDVIYFRKYETSPRKVVDDKNSEKLRNLVNDGKDCTVCVMESMKIEKIVEVNEK